MNLKSITAFLILLVHLSAGYSQKQTHKISLNVQVDKALKKDFVEEGRIFLFMTTDRRGEPYTKTFPTPWTSSFFCAKNIADFNVKEGIELNADDEWISTAEWTLDDVPAGEYNVQVLWDHDNSESRIEAAGNLFSVKQTVILDKDAELDLTISEVIAPRVIEDHPLAKVEILKSDLLTKFWNKPMNLKMSVLLPNDYDSTKVYPIRYNVAGYGGRYTRINRQLRDTSFMNWWTSGSAPQIITVYLDGEGPFGDSYQMDSDNSGPYGESLVTEIIPFIENKYRGTTSATNRFVDGCSTGGWVSLGLQLYYPDVFDGCFSYSPDAVEFENYQLINIYRDRNAYKNEFGYPRPVMRMPDGEPMISLETFMQYENVLGASNTYLNSGGQFSAHAALYSPKGDNGLPKPLIDPVSGDLDKEVADYWKKYDFKLYLEDNWNDIGPKLDGKIYVWMGDMDHFYLNQSARVLADYFETLSNPKSNAEFEFAAGEGHCAVYSHMNVLKQIQEKIGKK
jgi:S-formylglutathione hydrolase FrmB